MSELSFRDRELVALGAALAANCVPCVNHHVPKAREAGLTDAELAEVLALADTIRQVPARLVLESAKSAVDGGGRAAEPGNAESPKVEAPIPDATSAACREMMQHMNKGSACC